MGARLLTPEQVEALAQATFDEAGNSRIASLGQSCVNLGRLLIELPEDKVGLLAPLDSDLEELAIPSSRRS